ncbi:MAG TPA: zinc-dependent metalloprotease [Actinopolymorphaceae bacterium]|jgi:coenzyme F420 biosynthesis associated uncharacterized protein
MSDSQHLTDVDPGFDGGDGPAGAGPTPADASRFINWDLAVSTAHRLARPGPHATRAEIATAVADLRRFAAEATPLVRECTGLVANGQHAPVLVVDRPGWVQANVDAFSQVLDPLIRRLIGDREQSLPAIASKVGSQVTGVELGAVLAFLSGKVLGQFDPYHRAEGEVGRLLLVAPNVVAVERELGVDPGDFRLWVCLHEETHRVQFTTVTWLEGHLRGRLDALLSSHDLDPAAVFGRLKDGLDQTVRSMRGVKGDRVGQPAGLVDLVSTPEQKAVLDEITAMMTLVEGHADVVMDLAAPAVIKTLPEIRAKFDVRRRTGSSPVDQLMRRLLGMDAKMRQYREGALFVRAIVDRIGMDGFNQVWTSPETLPSKAEIDQPGRWLERVAGIAPGAGV